jgi:selenide,water dikinase
LSFDTARVPLLAGAIDLVERNTPGGGRTNKEHFGARVRAEGTIDPRILQLLYDPQTSGGLLAAIAPDSFGAAIGALQRAGVAAHEVGSVQGAHEHGQVVAVTLR